MFWKRQRRRTSAPQLRVSAPQLLVWVDQVRVASVVVASQVLAQVRVSQVLAQKGAEVFSAQVVPREPQLRFGVAQVLRVGVAQVQAGQLQGWTLLDRRCAASPSRGHARAGVAGQRQPQAPVAGLPLPLPLPLALGVAQVLRVAQVLLRVAQVLPHAPQLRLAQVLQHAPSSEHYARPRWVSRELPHAP